MASEFAKYLKRGIFKVPVCTKCGKKAWPPSSRCPACYSSTTLRQVRKTGVLVEFTTSYLSGYEGAFGIVEMAGFRLVGSFNGVKLSKGMRVRMVGCGVRDGKPYYLFAAQR